jgi:hypothetical protein
VGAHRYESALSAEIVDGTLPERRLSLRILGHNVLIRTPDSAGRLHRGGGAYREASLVSAVMLAGIGPVSPVLAKPLITHSEACGRKGRTAHAQPRVSSSEAYAASARARLNVGTHMNVSAVSEEIVGGTVPTRPG